MRIAYVLNGLGICGGVRVVFEHCTNLKHLGHDIEIICPDTEQDWFPLNVPIKQIPEGRYDIIVATHFSTVQQVQEYAKIDKRYYLVQMREEEFFLPDDLYNRGKVSRTYNPENGLIPITISWQLRNFLREKGYKKVHLVYCGVNTDMFYPDGKKKHQVLIEGYTSNPAKDCDGIAWAAATALKRRSGVEIYAYSQIPHPFVKYADRSYIRPSVQIMRRLYSQSFFLIKASRFDGSALAPIEAMACGTTTARAIEWGDPFMVNRKTCLRTAYNSQALLEAVIELYENPILRRELEEKCLEIARTKMSWRTTAKKLEKVFSS